MNDIATTPKPAANGRSHKPADPRPSDAGPTLTLKSKKGAAITVTQAGTLIDVISALEEFRLLARKAQQAGCDLAAFAQLLAARAEADRLQAEARKARAAYDRLLTIPESIPTNPQETSAHATI